MVREQSVGSNWSGNHDYAAHQLLYPADEHEVRECVLRGSKLRALGSRHSFNDLADTSGDLVSLERFDLGLEIDAEARTASFSAGARYGDLALELEQRGWALHNLASLPHICVAGAIATGTHGSGDRNGTLATAVSGLEFVNGKGELVSLSRGDTDFDGAVVSLGALGIVTRIRLDIEPSFQVRQNVYENLRWATALEQFDRLTSSAYSVSLFTDWVGDSIDSVWVKSRVWLTSGADAGKPPPSLLGALAAESERHMIRSMPSANTTAQRGQPGPWSERLAHFRMGFTPSSGDELQSEFLVPRSAARAAIGAVRGLGDRIAPVLHISELRTMAADTLWLSGAYETDAVGIHFTWKKLPEQVRPVLSLLEDRLLPLGARPHWGKMFLAGAEKLAPLYPRLGDFRALVARHDPAGVFRNDYLARNLGL